MKLIKFLPQILRVKLIRRHIRIQSEPEAFQIKIAKSKEELEKVYSLLHDCYVATKLMEPDPSGLRCNFYSFLPATTAVIATIGDKIVGTVSLIKDSPAGLPSDKDFKNENDQLRLNSKRLVEVSSLAIDSDYRKKSHVVSLYLMKYLQHYTTHYMGCTTVTCVVHPRASDFYAAFWGFISSKKIVKYKFVNDALGMQMSGDITDEFLSGLTDKFPSEPDRNPIHFLSKTSEHLVYPPRLIEHHLDPIFTPELLKHFISERTRAFQNMTRAQANVIFSSYSVYFENLEEISFFQGVVSEMRNRDFRFPCKIVSSLGQSNSVFAQGEILDINHSGAFFATKDQSLKLDKEYLLDFQLGTQKFSIPVTIAWLNRRNRNHQPLGFGLKFRVSELAIARIFKLTHLTAYTKLAK